MDHLNNQSYDFILKGEIPKGTHQSNLRVLRSKTRGWFVGKMSTSPVKKWMRDLTACAKQAEKRPKEKLSGPLWVTVEFNFKRPKSRPKSHIGKVIPHTVKPDLDNASKAVLDAVGDAGWWIDDSQISILWLTKTEVDNPFIKITVKTI